MILLLFFSLLKIPFFCRLLLEYEEHLRNTLEKVKNLFYTLLIIIILTGNRCYTSGDAFKKPIAFSGFETEGFFLVEGINAESYSLAQGLILSVFFLFEGINAESYSLVQGLILNVFFSFLGDKC